MSIKPHFHGSDLEKISEYYHIPKESIVNYGGNVNPLGLSESVKSELGSHLDIISAYPDREYTSLRRTIGEYCQVSPAHVIVGNGSSELIALLIEQCFPKKTLVLGPTYSEYERELSFSQSSMEYYNLDPERDFQLDMEAFLKTLEKDYDLLILCNPNNPTSSVIDNRDLEKILETCQNHHTFVMIDETYVEFTMDIAAVTAAALVDKYDNFMVLRGVSKFFAAPGLRLGYGISSNKALLKRIKSVQIPWSLNSIGAFAGERMLQDVSYIQKTRELILSERTRMLEELKKIANIRVFDAAGNFILIQIKVAGLTANDVFEACIKKGLMIRDCSSFQCLHGEYVRFCILKPADNDRLLDCLKSILS